jgi:hypothetical protein
MRRREFLGVIGGTAMMPLCGAGAAGREHAARRRTDELLRG